MRALGPILMTDKSRSPLHGLSVLLLEDEYLVALDAEQILKELGAKTVDVVNTLEDALKYADEKRVDVAVLDVNINGKMSFELADRFRQQGIPVVFASGYELSQLALPESEMGACLNKPYTTESVKRALLAALAQEFPLPSGGSRPEDCAQPPQPL